ncbi:MAG: helix-turn-helix domain-containing protein [Alistipes sp.]|nr:helix-turn-helix domain-containing protein [Alistipes sp.]
MEKRLQLLLQEMGLTPARFAEAIGIQPSAVSHLLSGRNKPSFDLLSKILVRFPTVNPRWLILGEEPIFTGSIPADHLQDLPEINLTDDPTTGSTIPLSEKLIFPETEIPVPDPYPIEPPKKEPVTHDKLADGIAAGFVTHKSHGLIKSVIIFFADGTFESYRPSRD